MLVDQTRRKRNGIFDPVGTFRFEVDGQSTVTVQTQGTQDGLVVVDAIRFVPAWPLTDIEIGVGENREESVMTIRVITFKRSAWAENPESQ